MPNTIFLLRPYYAGFNCLQGVVYIIYLYIQCAVDIIFLVSLYYFGGPI